jgi:hypothetical protein
MGIGVDGNHYKPNTEILTELKIDKKSRESIVKKVHSSIKEFQKVLI